MLRRASAALCVALWTLSATADPIELSSTRVGFSEEPAQEPEIVGKLQYRGGLHLTSPDPRFGGWSGLIADADGASLIAISDNGYWLIARPVYDRTGRLTAIADAGEIGTLQDPSGAPVRGRRRDAEEATPLPEGIAVSFEGEHRIWLYPHGRGPFAMPPRPLDPPLLLNRAPSNKGIETLAGLSDGRLLAITEGLFTAPDQLAGWVSAGPPHNRWSPLAWRTTGEFVPTGAATLPDDDVLVLERRFSWIGGLASRLSRLPATAIQPGATLQSTEVARLEVPLVHENFEGIAVAMRGGETLVYLISDDNYNPLLQRTLLVMFALLR